MWDPWSQNTWSLLDSRVDEARADMEVDNVNLRSEITLLSQIDQKCKDVFHEFLDTEVSGGIVRLFENVSLLLNDVCGDCGVIVVVPLLCLAIGKYKCLFQMM